MSVREISWLSMWAPLLEEAVEACVIADSDGVRRLRSCAASIILARTSWESFSNELIEQRGLKPTNKRLHTRKKLEHIFEELEGAGSSDLSQPMWENLLLTSAIRNAIIHQDAKSLRRGESPKDVLRRLVTAGVLSVAKSEVSWERQVFSPKVAVWSCRTVGEAIVSLEKIQSQQFRPPHLVADLVDRIIRPLARLRIG